MSAHWLPLDDHALDKATYRVAYPERRDLQAVSNGLPSGPVTQGGRATTTRRVGTPWRATWSSRRLQRPPLARGGGLPVVDAVDPPLTCALRSRLEASFTPHSRLLEAGASWSNRYALQAVDDLADQIEVAFAAEPDRALRPCVWRHPAGRPRREGGRRP